MFCHNLIILRNYYKNLIKVKLTISMYIMNYIGLDKAYDVNKQIKKVY